MKQLVVLTLSLCILYGCAGSKESFTVLPTAETVAVGSEGDAADDPAVLINANNQKNSLIIGTNKNRVNGGLQVYRLDGSIVDTVSDPGLNNVDLRTGFPFSTGEGVLIAASRRVDSTIALYTYDWNQNKLINVESKKLKTVESYGICMGYNPNTKEFYAFVNEKSGRIEQWHLFPTADGKINGKMVRVLNVPSQPEGCVVDDENGVLFVGEEEFGIWKFAAWPNQSTEGSVVDSVYRGGNLKADVEGMGIYTHADGTGYLVVSSQGDNSYVLYDRQAPHAHRGNVQIIGSETIDGTSETDGLEVSSVPMGQNFPEGVLVVQDGENDPRGSMQNFKIVDWRSISIQIVE